MSQEKKDELKGRLEEFLTEKGTHQRRQKCKHCGEGFLGRAGAGACGPACKKALQRKG